MNDTQNSLNINFTGDFSFTGNFKEKVLKGEEIFNAPILNQFLSADFNVVNLEGPATNSKTFYRNNGLVISPEESIPYLYSRNISCFNLANNHMFDNGVSGFNDTIKNIKQNQGFFFGAGLDVKKAIKPIVLEKNKIKVAMIGVCHKEGMIALNDSPGVLCIENNFKLIQKKLFELKKENTWVILNYHGGEEYTRIPMPKRRKLLKKLSDYACDLIIAHHSHVFQGYEIYRGKPIFYSLGNFVFDIPNHSGVQYIDLSAILKFSFFKERFTFSFVPAKTDANKGIVELGSESFLSTIELLSKKTTTNYNTNWLLEANRTFFKSKAPNSKSNKPIAKRHHSFWSLLKDKNNYFKFVLLLRSPNKRPLFLAAILSKVLQKFNLFNEKP